jgi:hypothetical protein
MLTFVEICDFTKWLIIISQENIAICRAFTGFAGKNTETQYN